MEVAGIEQRDTNKEGLNEATIEGGDMLVLTLKVPLETFLAAAEAMERYPDGDLEASPTMLKQLAGAMEEELDAWFGNEGGEWLEDRIGQDIYDGFLVDEETGLSRR